MTTETPPTDTSFMEQLAPIIASLSWPHVSLILGLVGFAVFYKQIAAFIDRTKKVSSAGVETDAPQISTGSTDEQRKQIVDQLMNLEDSVTRDELEETLRSYLDSINLDASSDTARVLIRNLASTQLALDLEQTYGSIFGSQIRLLRQLNQVNGMSVEEVNAEFMATQQTYRPALDQWKASDYLAYLINNSLAVSPDQHRLHITNKGREFLVWLTRIGRSENKAY